MHFILIITLLLLGLIALSLYWRYTSRVTNAPCPTWLAWMLDVNFVARPKGKHSLLEKLDLAPGMRVADIGCGPGRVTIPIAQVIGPEGEVTALDIQPGMLDRMSRRAAQHGLTNIRPLRAGAGEGALPHAHYDRALLVTVLGEIPDRERALREIHDALKPGGYLLISEVLGDPHYQFESKVRALAAQVNLRPAEKTKTLLSYSLRLYRDI